MSDTEEFTPGDFNADGDEAMVAMKTRNLNVEDNPAYIRTLLCDIIPYIDLSILLFL